mmetsp:Transcript_710/g.1646  ORF Transcript_710/g.1646 Transcript_710/m.1646 type:complete len:492 (-) Transcript_710:119-1594(-)
MAAAMVAITMATMAAAATAGAGRRARAGTRKGAVMMTKNNRSSSSSSSRAYTFTKSQRIFLPYQIALKKGEKARPSLFIILALATLGVCAFLFTQPLRGFIAEPKNEPTKFVIPAPQFFEHNATLTEDYYHRFPRSTSLCMNSWPVDNVYKLDNVRHGSFEISTSKDYAVCAAAWNGSERKELFDFPECNTTYQINYKETKSVTSLVGDYIAMPRWYPYLHAHILLDHLPPLAYLRGKCPQCNFLLQDTPVNRQVMNWLDRPFVKSRVHWIKDGERVSVQGNLMFTTPTIATPNIDFFIHRHWAAIDILRMWIKERKGKEKGSDKKYILYTSRNSPTANKRDVDPQHEKDIIEMIREAMAAHGRKESLVVFNGAKKDGVAISLQDQFDLFSSASAVIGPHGGAMANIMWMDLISTPQILEFVPTYAVQPYEDNNSNDIVRWENSYFGMYCGAPWTEYKLMTLSPNSTREKSYVNLTSLRDALDTMMSTRTY